MDFQQSCTSRLPWIWVMETLAHSNQIDTSVLLELLEKTPEISDDLGRNAREAVSLKILERFSAQGTRAKPVSSASTEKIKLDPSDSCDNVLRKIVSKISASHMKSADLEMAKWDIQAFIKHKRSSLAKYTLQQLKDAILTGKSSVLASLKEQSSLDVAGHEARIDGSNCNGITPGCEGSTAGNPPLPRDLPSENLAVDKKRKVSSENAGGTSCEDQLVANNSSVKKHKHDIICSKQSVGVKLLSSGVDARLADTSAVCLEHNEGETCNLGTNHGGDTGINSPPNDHRAGSNGGTAFPTKSNKSLDHQHLPSSLETTNQKYQNLLADASKGCTTKRYSLAEKTHVDVTMKSGSPADHDNKCTSLHRLDDGHEEVLPHEERAPRCDAEVPNDKFVGEKMQDNAPNVTEAEEGVNLSSDSDAFHDEEISIDKKKKIFLSSQCTYSLDSLATTSSGELNLCMKCGKGEKLLVCSSDSCPLVIHASCLGSDASYDTSGKFYCPFCAYAQAISNYMEIKKKASLARKDLATFFCVGNQKKSKEQSRKLSRINPNPREPDDGLSRSNKGKRDVAEKVYTRQQRKELENEQAGPSELHSDRNRPTKGKAIASTDKIAHDLDKDKQERKRTPRVSGQSKGKAIASTDKIAHDLDKDKQERKRTPRVSGQSKGKAIASTDKIAPGLDKVKQEGKRTTRASRSLRFHGEQMDELAIHNSLEENTNSQRNNVSENHTNIRSRNRSPCPPETDLRHEQRHSSNSESDDWEETSEEENRVETSGTSKYFTRSRRKKKYTYPPIPHLRRKTLPWSTEEERILMEGIRLLSNPTERTMPWKKILEFGSEVFEKSRTTIDLKDKWRNICRAAQKN